MFAIFSTLFSVIALPEPAITEDDTAATMTVNLPEYITGPIVINPTYGLDQFRNTQVGYRQRTGDVLQVGTVGGIEETIFGGIQFYFVPRDGGISKWRDMQDFVSVVEA